MVSSQFGDYATHCSRKNFYRGLCPPHPPYPPFGLFRGIRDFWLTKPRKLNFRLRGIWLMNPGFAASERFNVRAGKGNSFPLTRDERSLFTGSELGGHSSLGLGSRRRAVNRLLKKFSLPFRGIHQPFFPNTQKTKGWFRYRLFPIFLWILNPN